jgi:hypothetical protein
MRRQAGPLRRARSPGSNLRPRRNRRPPSSAPIIPGVTIGDPPRTRIRLEGHSADVLRLKGARPLDVSYKLDGLSCRGFKRVARAV